MNTDDVIHLIIWLICGFGEYLRNKAIHQVYEKVSRWLSNKPRILQGIKMVLGIGALIFATNIYKPFSTPQPQITSMQCKESAATKSVVFEYKDVKLTVTSTNATKETYSRWVSPK